MFEQSLFAVAISHRAFLLNFAGLVLGVAGGWLLIAARLRGAREVVRAVAAQGQSQMVESGARLLRINRMFSTIGVLALALALLFSTLSTHL